MKTKKSRALVPVDVGTFFRIRRKELGLSVEQVASYLENVSVDTLKRYESGDKPIPLNDIYALSNCLNVSPRTINDLLSGTFGN